MCVQNTSKSHYEHGSSYTEKSYDNGRSEDQSALTLFQIQPDEFANLEACKYLKL
jgi:hypothetical protein